MPLLRYRNGPVHDADFHLLTWYPVPAPEIGGLNRRNCKGWECKEPAPFALELWNAAACESCVPDIELQAEMGLLDPEPEPPSVPEARYPFTSEEGGTLILGDLSVISWTLPEWAGLKGMMVEEIVAEDADLLGNLVELAFRDEIKFGGGVEWYAPFTGRLTDSTSLNSATRS